MRPNGLLLLLGLPPAADCLADKGTCCCRKQRQLLLLLLGQERRFA
jgi:hypothetical protein